MNHPIASDLSYLVLQKRRERGEIGPGGFDRNHQPLYPIAACGYRRFIADVDEIGDTSDPQPSRVVVRERE